MNSIIRNWASSLAIALIALQITAVPSSADNQAPTQVADSIPGAGGSEPLRGAVLNGKYYFPASDPVNGFELRVYDGTNPPSLVQDIASGSASSFYSAPIVYNAKLYFNATDGTNGYELWVYDAGTGLATMVQNIHPTGSSNPYGFTVFNNKLYFSATNGTDGYELWVYDDGTGSATMVQNIHPTQSSSPEGFTVFNNKLYFSATNGTDGSELWVYDDGTGLATMVQDIRVGIGGSQPQYLTVFNNKLYFSAYVVAQGRELWSYDGTSSAANAKDIRLGSSSSTPHYLTLFNNKLYFAADDGGGQGYELWSYDSTGSVYLVQDINPGSNSSYPSSLGVFEDNLYFAAYGGTGYELWEYDGTSATVIDINPTGNGIDDGMGWGPQFAATSMGFFFAADDGTTGFELWSIAPAPEPATAAAPYAGPLLQNFSSRTLDVCTPKSITITGTRLSGVTASVQGKSVTVLENTATKLVLAFPAGLTPGQDVDLVINSSHGTLTHQDAFDIPAQTCVEDLITGSWTKNLTNGPVKMYAKNIVGAGKVQFMVNGKEVAWVRAVDETDAKLREANGSYYLVRTVDLVEGQKNVLEIYVDGVRSARSAYSY
jgi:ELWxxDGT repeat protein